MRSQFLAIRKLGLLIGFTAALGLAASLPATGGSSFHAPHENTASHRRLEHPADSQPIKVAFQKKQAGVFYATTDSGEELPVLDVANPTFEPRFKPLSRMHSLLSQLPLRLIRLIPVSWRQSTAPRSSHLLAEFNIGAKFLSGDATYRAKLGPRNNPNLVDQFAAGSKLAGATFYRLRAIAELESQALEAGLRQASLTAGVHFLSIAGGHLSDSLNALLMIHRKSQSLLEGRPITISTMDLNAGGSNFARRAVEALSVPGAPLAGLDIKIDFQEGSWSDETAVRRLLQSASHGDVSILSSEGGLFEYAEDADILKVLKLAAEPAIAPMSFIGSAFWGLDRVDPGVPLQMKTSKMDWKLRGLESRLAGQATGIRELAEAAGWRIEAQNVLNDVYPTFTLRQKNSD